MWQQPGLGHSAETHEHITLLWPQAGVWLERQGGHNLSGCRSGIREPHREPQTVLHTGELEIKIEYL